MKNKYVMLVVSVVTLFFIFSIANANKVSAADSSFQYESTQTGNYINNGIEDGDTYNYSFENTSNIPVDDEGFINYQNQAYLKKTVKPNPQKQGLFDITLDIKGNQISHPLDIVLVIDYSSSMQGEKLSNTLKGLNEFGTELGDSLSNGIVKIGIVAYNRNIYSTNGFTNDLSQLENFLTTTAESHTGTFIQKGLIAGQELLNTQSRPNAEKMLIHIGDGSANRSFLPVENAPDYPNNGEIIDYNGFHTQSYNKDFQTSSEKFNSSDTISDPNATIVEKNIVTDATLGTIVSMKESGIKSYSIGTAPTARGEYIARNIADKESHYRSIDENLVDLGEALKEIVNAIDRTIPNGTVIDPMGNDILLQGSGNFSKDNYELAGWKKDLNGNWVTSEELTENINVAEQNQVITISNIILGAKERITLTYQIRINTESSDFKGDYWYLCNQRTILDPSSDGSLLDFPIPSIKAPKVDLSLEKQWKSTPKDVIPEKVEYQVKRTPTADPNSWKASNILSLTKANNFKTTISTVPINESNSDLPVYNNAGDTINYSIEEVNVPIDFSPSINQKENHFTLINTYKKIATSNTESSTSNSTTDSSLVTTTSSSMPSGSSQSTAIAKSNTSSNKRYPQTNDVSTDPILILIGVILFVGSAYYLVKTRIIEKSDV